MTKVSQMFRASRGLRRRPRVERNIYSASNTGVRASDVRPQPSAPSLRRITGSVDRSITGMRLPAIPPSEVDTTVPQTTQRPLRVDSKDSRPPAVLPTDASSPSEVTPPEVQLDTINPSSSSDVPLPTPITREDSDSDNSDDDKEYIPNHRFTMVRVNSAHHRKERNDKVEQASHSDINERNDQPQQYANVADLKDITSHSDNNEENDQPQQYINVADLKDELNAILPHQVETYENKAFTEDNHEGEGITNDSLREDETLPEYASVVKEKRHSSKTENLEDSTVALPLDENEKPSEI